MLVDIGACSSNSAESVEQAMVSLLQTGHIGDLNVTDQDFTIREVGRDPTREECRESILVYCCNIMLAFHCGQISTVTKCNVAKLVYNECLGSFV